MTEGYQINERIFCTMKKSPFEVHREKPYIIEFRGDSFDIAIRGLASIDLELLGHQILDFVKGNNLKIGA